MYNIQCNTSADRQLLVRYISKLECLIIVCLIQDGRSRNQQIFACLERMYQSFGKKGSTFTFQSQQAYSGRYIDRYIYLSELASLPRQIDRQIHLPFRASKLTQVDRQIDTFTFQSQQAYPDRQIYFRQIRLHSQQACSGRQIIQSLLLLDRYHIASLSFRLC